jgi:hypothetical protein
VHRGRRELLAPVLPDHADRASVELRAGLLRKEQELVGLRLAVEDVRFELEPKNAVDYGQIPHLPALAEHGQITARPGEEIAQDEVVKATRTFAWEGGVVRQGETYRGNDPAVVAGWNAFVHGETLDQELENPFDALPPPSEHAPPVEVRSSSIPIHRQVKCVVDAAVPVQWAPDTAGSRSKAPPPFLRSQLRSGQILDVLSDVVREHPSWFRWPERDVTAEDVERLKKLQRLEREGDQAVR